MPTPILIDGFEHQVTSINSFSSNGNGLWENTNNLPTFVSGRNGQCMRITMSASTVNIRKHLLSSRTNLVGSFYIRTSTSPGSNMRMWDWQDSSFQTVVRGVLTSAGLMRMENYGVNSSVAINDGVWHRIDLGFNGTADTIDWTIDGVAQTQLTGATMANVLYMVFGSTLSSTITVDFDDLVLSETIGDYPMGVHDVLAAKPNADGSYSQVGGNLARASDNSVIDGTPTAYDLLDEWPPTTGTNNADTVTQIGSGSGNYVEVEFENKAAGTIWGVEGVAALQSDGTTANNGTTRIVDGSGNTLTDIYASDMSETSAHYRRAIITAPGAGWDSGFDSVKARIGFSSNIASQPEWLTLMLQYATAAAGGGAASIDPFGMMGFWGA